MAVHFLFSPPFSFVAPLYIFLFISDLAWRGSEVNPLVVMYIQQMLCSAPQREPRHHGEAETEAGLFICFTVPTERESELNCFIQSASPGRMRAQSWGVFEDKGFKGCIFCCFDACTKTEMGKGQGRSERDRDWDHGQRRTLIFAISGHHFYLFGAFIVALQAHSLSANKDNSHLIIQSKLTISLSRTVTSSRAISHNILSHRFMFLINCQAWRFLNAHNISGFAIKASEEQPQPNIRR